MSSQRSLAWRRGTRGTNQHVTVGRNPNTAPAGPFTNVNPYSAVVAPRLVTRLRYGQIITMTTDALGNAVNAFNLNSLFDPDRTGAGHQPRGFDEISTLYNRYRVYGLAYKITASTSGTDLLQLAAYPRNGTGTPVTFSDSVEQPFAQSSPVTAYQVGRISGYVDLPKINGKTRAAYAADDTTQAEVSTSPSETMVLNTQVFSMTTTQNSVVRMFVLLEFDCEFSDPKSLVES
jgi:hypothetical protein